ncbi:MAG: SAP domain-containing protein [Methanomassiliicoccaceae archaeon]|nr:SAP domain-containing protein [Methanomassiliicoccaceae archaeon]
MTERPDLNRQLDSNTFRNYYYLKEELVQFCRQEGLQTTGGKEILTERISHYLDTGEELTTKTKARPSANIGDITEETLIEDNFVCSEARRAFFEQTIGKGFHFNVVFMRWLKSNAGKSYGDAIQEYYRIRDEKKKGKTAIGKQFEYNAYIRDFFADTQGMRLEDAILCWEYKKSLPGHNRYERKDLFESHLLGDEI